MSADLLYGTWTVSEKDRNGNDEDTFNVGVEADAAPAELHKQVDDCNREALQKRCSVFSTCIALCCPTSRLL